MRSAIALASLNSAPSPEEKVFTIMIKRGGDALVKAITYIVQKCWTEGVLPDSFKLDPKIMLPKPGKDDYNSVRSYRPITLESVIGKIFERVVKGRLVWKLEVTGTLATTQYAYRRQKSCVQSMVRLVNSLYDARNKKEHLAVAIMDFESCYERIWRAGLLKKAADAGISSRLWQYLWNFLHERRFYIKVNEFTSTVMTSRVGIPQGSVISPVLCNLYTHDAMKEVLNSHSEFADDSCVWARSTDLNEVEVSLNRDIENVTVWCRKWNMSIAPDKTEVLKISPKGSQDSRNVNVVMNGMFLKETPKKKVLGMLLDQDLTFKAHIEEKAKASYRALKGLEIFSKDFRGCPQSIFMRLYKSLVVPLFDYAAAVLVLCQDECVREFGKVQRTAMLKASGCLSSTSTDALQVLTNCTPIDLHLKLRQAQELVRLVAKNEGDSLKDEWNDWRSSEGYSRVSQIYSECFSLDSMKLEEIWSSAELKKTSSMTVDIWGYP